LWDQRDDDQEEGDQKKEAKEDEEEDKDKEEEEEEEDGEEENDSSSESETEGADLSHVSTGSESELEPSPLFLKCKPSVKRKVEKESEDEGAEEKKKERDQQTELTLESLGKMVSEAEELRAEVEKLEDKVKELEEAGSAQVKSKVERLESQNSVLKEKSSDIRSENDRLVAKIQKLQSRISQESQIRVSVSEYEDGDPDDIFNFGSSPTQSRTRSPESRVKVSVTEDYILDEDKRFEEAAEKIMRLEQRVTCLQNANNVNSCATCRPLRAHVLKIERQLVSLTQERKGQLEELYELKQEALSSAVSEKDAHLQWLEVAGEGSSNAHTRGTLERLRRERRDLLNRMKEENENRMALISALDETSSLFTGTGKISTLGSLHRGESLLDADSPGVQSTSSYQSASTGEEDDLASRCLIPLVTCPRETQEEDEDNQSSKSF